VVANYKVVHFTTFQICTLELLMNLGANLITKMNSPIFNFPPRNLTFNRKLPLGIKLLQNLPNGTKILQDLPNEAKPFGGVAPPTLHPC